jgi:hypothetical protein
MNAKMNTKDKFYTTEAFNKNILKEFYEVI